MRRIAFSLFFLLFASGAFSQTAISGVSTRSAGGQVTATATFQAANFPMNAVAGAPYYGEETQEQVQTLLDGTHIKRSRGTIKTYRDSQGRTRTERPLMMGMNGPKAGESPVVVEISDPVAGVRYTLDEQNKVAHRAATNTPGPLAVRSGTFSDAIGPPATPAGAARNVAPARQIEADPTRPQIATEKLGTQVMEGIVVEGTRMTTTYPVDSQGNDRPIVVTTEMWRSPDLKITVLSKSTDPRSGESTTRVTNINRAEPDPSLFQPPPGYTVVEETGSFSIQYPR